MATVESTDSDVQIVRQLALTATFTALVFMSTSIFSFELVPTTGYFNFGESFVYLAALIGGPIVGAVAGGFGSFLADSFLGFGDFAFATLVLKGLEGFAVGLLFNFGDKVDQKKRRIFLLIISPQHIHREISIKIFLSYIIENNVDNGRHIYFVIVYNKKRKNMT